MSPVEPGMGFDFMGFFETPRREDAKMFFYRGNTEGRKRGIFCTDDNEGEKYRRFPNLLTAKPPAKKRATWSIFDLIRLTIKKTKTSRRTYEMSPNR